MVLEKLLCLMSAEIFFLAAQYAVAPQCSNTSVLCSETSVERDRLILDLYMDNYMGLIAMSMALNKTLQTFEGQDSVGQTGFLYTQLKWPI